MECRVNVNSNEVNASLEIRFVFLYKLALTGSMWRI